MGKDKKTLELDKYESGVIFHSLNEKRNQMLKEGRATDAVDDILLKVIALMEKYLTDNRKFEIRQLKEWIDDINSQTKLRWILTLINKADVWYEEEDEVMNYYKNGEYSQLFNGIERFCTLHYIPYCSTISPFGGKPMILHISENDKRKLHFNVVKSIQKFILNVR